MKSQTDIITSLQSAGVAKTSYPFGIFSARAIMAGAFIALGGILSVVASAGFAYNPSLQKIVSGLTFPIGLVLTVVFGAELFTGNCAALIPGYAARRFGAGALMANWAMSWIGNFVGALLIVALCVAGSGLLATEPFAGAITKIASAKLALDPMTAFWRGIGCNWLVCLAVWLALTSDSLGGKIAGCWLPVAAFVILGFEHCIANMFFIPAGMVQSGSYDFIAMFANLLPVTLGNIVGGMVFVGCLNTWLYANK